MMRETARLAGACVAGIVCSRRRRRRARRRRYGPVGVDSSGWWSKSRVAVTMEPTAVPGEAPNGGDGRRPAQVGFRIGENLAEEEENRG
jgi:hypothetical protein